MDKKKLTGGLAGLLAVVLYGGSEVLDLSARLSALEVLHPELVTAEPEDVAQIHDAEPVAEPEAEAEATDPAPGEDALKLNEEDTRVVEAVGSHGRKAGCEGDGATRPLRQNGGEAGRGAPDLAGRDSGRDQVARNKGR